LSIVIGEIQTSIRLFNKEASMGAVTRIVFVEKKESGSTRGKLKKVQAVHTTQFSDGIAYF